MKRTLLAVGVLTALACSGIAYAYVSLEHQESRKSVALAAQETSTSSTDAISSEDNPGYGVSIGTVEAQLYSGSGLSLSYFSGVKYVAQIGEEIRMGFNEFLQKEYDEKEGIYKSVKCAELVVISSNKKSITVPDYICVSGNIMPVRKINGGYALKQAIKDCKIQSLTIPVTVTTIDNNHQVNYMLNNLFMLGNAPKVDGYSLLVNNVYVCDKSCVNGYLDNEAFGYSYIFPYGWDFDWLTVNVTRKGEFAQTYLEMTDAKWGAGRKVKITGDLDATDVQNIRRMYFLTQLDLSEAKFSTLPESFLADRSLLKEVIFPETINYIPKRSFYDCSSLERVVAKGVWNIHEQAFSGCSALKEFDISKVKTIGSHAFYNCVSFSLPIVSDVLSSIEDYAFAKSGITEMLLPNTLTTLGSNAFSECTALKKVAIPSSIKTIGQCAFSGCKNLKDISLSEGLNTIGNNVFYNCVNLLEITLPSTLETIGSDAFYGCSSLKSIKCKAVVPPAANGNFTNGMDLNHCTVYVAPFTIDAYRAASYWNAFYIMKPLEEPIRFVDIDRPVTINLLSEDNAVLQNNPNLSFASTDFQR